MTEPAVRWLFNIFGLAIFLPGIWAVLVGTYSVSSRYGPDEIVYLDDSPFKGAFFIAVSWVFGCLFLCAANPELLPWMDRLGGPLAGLVPSTYRPICSAINLTLASMCVVLLLRKVVGSTFSPKHNVDLPPEVMEAWAEKCLDPMEGQEPISRPVEHLEDAGSNDYLDVRRKQERAE